MSLQKIAISIYDSIYYKLIKIRDWKSRYSFENRSKNHENLVVVLSGYKDKVSPLTIRRLEKHLPDGWDICIISAGKYDKNLSAVCQQLDWSYLSVDKNKTGLALNISINIHPKAKWICKMDEDIFISNKFFENLKDGYIEIKNQGDYNPGATTPILNINGVTYRIFLEKMKLLHEYQHQFKEKLISCGDVKIHHDAEAAKWIWKKSLPFDSTAKFFFNEEGYTAVPTRFSIGAILFERDFWQQIRGFRSSWASGILGADEEHFCKECMNRSRPIIVLHNTLAGHFSFGPQEAEMLKNLSSLSQQDPETFAQ
jgi:hypothetical protein